MSLSNDTKIELFNEVFPVGSEALYPAPKPCEIGMLVGSAVDFRGQVVFKVEGSAGLYLASEIKSPNHGDCPHSFGDAVLIGVDVMVTPIQAVFLRVDPDNSNVYQIGTSGSTIKSHSSMISANKMPTPTLAAKDVTIFNEQYAIDERVIVTINSKRYPDVIAKPAVFTTDGAMVELKHNKMVPINTVKKVRVKLSAKADWSKYAEALIKATSALEGFGNCRCAIASITKTKTISVSKLHPQGDLDKLIANGEYDLAESRYMMKSRGYAYSGIGHAMANPGKWVQVYDSNDYQKNKDTIALYEVLVGELGLKYMLVGVDNTGVQLCHDILKEIEVPELEVKPKANAADWTESSLYDKAVAINDELDSSNLKYTVGQYVDISYPTMPECAAVRAKLVTTKTAPGVERLAFVHHGAGVVCMNAKKADGCAIQFSAVYADCVSAERLAMEACEKFNKEFSRGESVEYTDSVGNVYQCTIDLLAHYKHGYGPLVAMTNQHGKQMLGDPARVVKVRPLVQAFKVGDNVLAADGHGHKHAGVLSDISDCGKWTVIEFSPTCFGQFKLTDLSHAKSPAQVECDEFNAKFKVGDEIVKGCYQDLAIVTEAARPSPSIRGEAIFNAKMRYSEDQAFYIDNVAKSPAQILVDEFNADYPVGSPVKVKHPADDYAALTGRKGAFIDSGGVVQVQIVITEGNLIVFPRNIYRPDLKTTYG